MRIPVPYLLGLTLFLSGVGLSATAPYRGIVAIDVLGISRVTYGAVMTGGAIAGAILSVLLGCLADRVGDRRPLVLLTALAGVIGYGLIFLVPTPLMFIASTALILPLAQAINSQSFSYSRAWYTDHKPEQGEYAMSVLRTWFSVAWVVVPPLAGALAAGQSPIAVFGAAALASVLIAGTYLHLGHRQDAVTIPPPKKVAAEGQSHGLPADRIIGIFGVLMTRTALFLHITILPLAIVSDIGGTLGQVGINASIGAGLEVPLMILWARAARRMNKELILAIAAATFAIYMGLMGQAQTMHQVYLLQGINAIATAALVSITISYMQETIKDRVGLSTSLMDAVTVVAMLIASALFGLMPADAGYLPLFTIAAGISLAGAVFLTAAQIAKKRTA